MIDVRQLRRSFGPIVAVDGISFAAQKGDVVGFLGPNGAGKSTAMKMLACFLRPDGGTATICGHDILNDPIGVRMSLGYLAENAPAYNEMTVAGFLDFVCDARQVKGGQRKKALDRVVPLCSIESVYHQTIETLSKGYRRRVGLAQSLIHDPPVLILDEPTAGVDVELRRQLWDYVRRINAEGVTILLTTHYLEEAQELCDTIAIMNHGRVIACEPTGQLLRRLDTRTVVVAPDQPQAAPPALEGFSVHPRPGGAFSVTYRTGQSSVEQVLAAVRGAGITIRDIATEDPDLEDVFLALTYGDPDARAPTRD